MARIFAVVMALCVLALPTLVSAGVVDRYRGTMRFVTPLPAFPKAKNGVIYLEYMPGGEVGLHMRHMKVWLDQGYRLVIRDDQYSAAAMMVVQFKHLGGKVCAHRRVVFGFHQPNNEDGRAMFGAKYAAIIGTLPVRGWKRIAPAQFGIPRCR